MKAMALFREHKSEIVRLWAEEVFNTYPFETTGFLRTREDPFSNPVANMTKEAADALYDAMSGEHVDPAQTKHALERFIKLRAVQKFAPSQGLGVFFLMKPILRGHLLPKFMALGDVAPYMEAESRLDSLTLLAHAEAGPELVTKLVLVDELPRNSTGKLPRSGLQALYADRVGHGRG